MQKLSALTINTDDPAILMALIKAHRPLAELKGIVKSIPNQQILLELLSNLVFGQLNQAATCSSVILMP